jgi:hypothetical protein
MLKASQFLKRPEREQNGDQGKEMSRLVAHTVLSLPKELPLQSMIQHNIIQIQHMLFIMQTDELHIM